MDALTRASSVATMMGDQPSATENQSSYTHFVVSVDFGTTFSSVAVIALRHGHDSINGIDIDPNRIRNINTYPDAPTENSFESMKDVPTESWYPKGISRRSKTIQASTELELTPSNSDRHRQSCHVQRDSEKFDGFIGSSPLDVPDKHLWGYSVLDELEDEDTNCDRNKHVSRSKLLLDDSQITAVLREKIKATIQELKAEGLIKESQEVISDFLTHLLRHTREQLIRIHGYTDIDSVELVLCVPAMWTQKACLTMQSALGTAAQESGFGKVTNGAIDNLFIVSEPEAAASWVIRSFDSELNACL